MADIGNLTGLSVTPHLDAAATSEATAAAQQQLTTKNMLNPVASPLPNFDHFRTTGAAATGSDSLRLGPPGKWGPTQIQMTNLASALKRFEQPAEHRFSGVAEKAIPILKKQHQFMIQMASGFTYGRT